MADKRKNGWVWAGLGAGVATVFATIIFLFYLSVQGNYPLSYGTEPYGSNPYEEEICSVSTALLET